jgi:hypothetical protein
MDIQLNFINQSNDLNSSKVVIFQKNVATDFEELSVAWQVIQNCGQGENHPFTFPMGMQVGSSDAWGNFSPKLVAQSGQMFEMAKTANGDQLSPTSTPVNPTEVHVLNSLPVGAMNASIYKAGKLLATKTSIVPQEKAVFQFKPTIWIGVASQVEEGKVMNSAIISAVNTEIPLLGIASADILMTGGGPGTTSTAFKFSLSNVVYA